MLYQTELLGENPSDKTFLKICFVCKDKAKAGQEHLRNYGGIVCYSCRAFWRRSHQHSRRPNFICKKTNQCQISVATRRRCQKCRYDRCLLAGMNPDAVLDTEQKKVRFRKLLKKQQKILSDQSKSKVPLPSTLRYFTSAMDQRNSPSSNRIESFRNSQPIFLKNRPFTQNCSSMDLSQTLDRSFYQQHRPVFLPQRNEMVDDLPLDLRIPEKSSSFCSLDINIVEKAEDLFRVMSKIG
jgi:hypothetical protein